MGTQGCFEFLEKSIYRAVQLGIIVEGHFVPNKINREQIERARIIVNNVCTNGEVCRKKERVIRYNE